MNGGHTGKCREMEGVREGLEGRDKAGRESGQGSWAAALFPDEHRLRAHSGDGRTHIPLMKVAERRSWTPHGSLSPWPPGPKHCPILPSLELCSSKLPDRPR